MSSTKRMRPLLGTFVEIGVSVGHLPEEAINAGFDAVAEVQALMSFHDQNSDLSKLNLAGGLAITLQPHSIRVLRLARAMTLLSGGLFNCTVGGALVRMGVLPDHGRENVLDIGVAEDIELKGSKVRLRRNVLVTLDGIAKGYAIDCAVKAMKSYGAKAGWVNAGGDLRAFGELVLPVQRREVDGRYSALGGLHDAAIASTSVRLMHDKSFPAWIFSENRSPELGTWSVMARQAWRADALTKVACLANPHERNQLIERLGGKLVAINEVNSPCA
jgi:FAD:protein FMN transferase